MRFLEVIPSTDLRWGGPIEAVLQRARALRERGHVTELLTLDGPNEGPGVTSEFVTHRVGPGRSRYGYSKNLVPWLRSHAADFDATIVHGLWHFVSFGTWLGMRGASTPYFVFPHGMLDPWFKKAHRLKHLKKWLYWPWADYRVLRDARGVLFTCEEECQLARDSFWLYRCQERVVGLGIAQPAQTKAQSDDFVSHFPQLRGKRILLFLGRLHPKKGCDLLIRAFARAVKAGLLEGDQPVHLLLAGPDQVGWLADLMALASNLGIRDRITACGMLTGDLKTGAFGASDAFVLPSHQENFGIAVAEAMACGLPVLISNKVNIWREIEQDRAGLVADDDLEGTFGLIQKWYSLSGEQQAAYRAAAIRSFQSRFEVSAAAEMLLEVVRACGGQPKSASSNKCKSQLSLH